MFPCSRVQEPGKEEYRGTLGSYISDALGSVFGSNFSNSDKAAAADFEDTTFSCAFIHQHTHSTKTALLLHSCVVPAVCGAATSAAADFEDATFSDDDTLHDQE